LGLCRRAVFTRYLWQACQRTPCASLSQEQPYRWCNWLCCSWRTNASHLFWKSRRAMLVDLGYCLAEDLVTHEDSETCQQAQKFNLGCHACGKLGCCVTAWNCHDKCSAHFHVCGPGDLTLGCGTCGRLCHESNADLRCPYYEKKRGQFTWATTDHDMMDT